MHLSKQNNLSDVLVHSIGDKDNSLHHFINFICLIGEAK